MTRDEALKRLAWYYKRNGYVRAPIPERLLREGWHYHKGWEVRLSLAPGEVAEVRGLLSVAGLTQTQPFAKHSRMIQPIYGRDVVLEVLAAAGEPLDL